MLNSVALFLAWLIAIIGVCAPSHSAIAAPDEGERSSRVSITGELKQWHKVTLDLVGPNASETDTSQNPFLDYRMTVEFVHEPSSLTYRVPGYFAADGDAANTSAAEGDVWRAHLSPDLPGRWKYKVSFVSGKRVAISNDTGEALPSYDGLTGSFEVAPTDKQGRDWRARGRLQYIGERYLRSAGDKQYFLKVGADSPETLLAYTDFDGTVANKPKKVPLKTWSPHIRDWRHGDPVWQGDKGKGLIGAVNYLSGKGCNAFSFIPYNAGGDGDNVWPFVERDDKLHYDCSKLDQWGIVFDHATTRGMYLHFKMQETENDDNRHGIKDKLATKPEAFDGGDLGVERKLYCRELVARFGHNLALNWNIGEENTQSTKQQRAMLDYLAELDLYGHNRVLHTYPSQQDKKYKPLLRENSPLTGLSLQNNHISETHGQTVKWVQASQNVGRPVVVAFDESGSAAHGQCPDLGYRGFDGIDNSGKQSYTPDEVRRQTLWGNLMAGGAGVEYYFGYQFDENDLLCEDWRSRDKSWDYCRIAIEFFRDNRIPFWNMDCQDQLVDNPEHNNSTYCFAQPGLIYLVYLPEGGTAELDLSDAKGQFKVRWFNPRTGGDLIGGTTKQIEGGERISLGPPPKDIDNDWLVILRRE